MDDKRFKVIFTIVIAGITFLGALLAYLNTEAGMNASIANRDSRILAIQSLPQEMNALQEITRARRQMTTQEEINWMAQVDVLLQIDYQDAQGIPVLEAWQRLLQLNVSRSPTLNQELQTASAITPSHTLIQIYLQGYVIPQALIGEQQRLAKRVATVWSNKSSAYLTGITILAVVLFLLTLSLTITTRMRYVFSLVGLFLALAVVVYALINLLAPFSLPTTEALRMYSQAMGSYAQSALDYQVNNYEAIRPNAEEAIQQLDQAIALSSDFPSAYSLRGKSWSSLGQSEVFGRRDLQAAQADFQRAIPDLQMAIQQGQEDFDSHLSLGVAQLYAGDHAGAQRSFQRAAALAPQQKLLIGLDMAVNDLFWGKPEEALQATGDAIQHAASNRLYSDSYIFRKLIFLMEQMKSITPVDGIDPILKRVKEAYVSLEFLGTAAPLSGARFSPLFFGYKTADSQGEPVLTPTSVFPAYTPAVFFSFSYEAVPPGTKIVQKVYLDWNEKFLLERAYEWSLRESGSAIWFVRFPISEAFDYLISGTYQVELFADGELLSSGSFTVENP
ncbi:MAG: hypothetical protein WCP58_07835 [bacterium]